MRILCSKWKISIVRHKKNNLSRRDLSILLNKRTCANHAVLFNNNSIKQGGTHANKSFILNGACMQNSTMTWKQFGHMGDRVKQSIIKTNEAQDLVAIS
jgi:hypothetical protein